MSLASAAPVQLNVPGRLESRADCEALVDALAELATQGTPIALTLYDALTLPARVVEAISALMRRNVPVQIQVYQRYLAHQLSRLGIPARLVTAGAIARHHPPVGVDPSGGHPIANVLASFLDAVYLRWGYDYRGYQPDTVRRRIRSAMILLGCATFAEFQQRVLTQPESFNHFFLEMSVEVTSFFRHPEQLRLLRDEVLPWLDSFPHLRIWSAGCATGEEVFSLAILLEEAGMLAKSRIYATDLNPHALAQAQTGLFPLAHLAANRTAYRAAGGRGVFDDYVEHHGHYLKVVERLRERVLFHQHSLIQDGVFNEFQLILCRNVLIYFRSEIQKQVIARLAEGLHADGFLLLGAREGLLDEASQQLFTPVNGTSSRIFRWRRT